jgi:hypothetical protein
VPVDEEETVATLIFRYLTSSPGIISHRRADKLDPEISSSYLDSLHKAVSKGSPIDVFITAFSPKFKTDWISNGQIFPDMADLLTFVHLQLIAKGIRDIYPYGFRFLVCFKGRVHEPIGRWGEGNLDETFRYLERLNGVSEGITGVRNAVFLYDIKDLISSIEEEYTKNLLNEFSFVKERYEQGDGHYKKKIDAWMADFRKFADPDDFKGTDFEASLFQEALTYRAYKNIRFKGGPKNLGICSSFPHVLQVNTRGNEPSISLQLNPYFRFHSHQRLITLRQNEWKTATWHEIKDEGFEPVFFDEFPYPFYYQKKDDA